MTDKQKLILSAEKDKLSKFIEFIIHFARDKGFSGQKLWELELAIDEVLTNIIDYAYPRERGNIEVSCSFDNKKGLSIEMKDHGIPFNPLSFPEPELTHDIQKVKTSGFGIFLFRRFMDNIEYNRERNMNCLVLEKTHES